MKRSTRIKRTTWVVSLSLLSIAAVLFFGSGCGTAPTQPCQSCQTDTVYNDYVGNDDDDDIKNPHDNYRLPE